MIQYGIKLWTTNKKYFKEAPELFERGGIDFVELYIVPDSFDIQELKILKQIPTIIHSAHEEHNFNIFHLDDRSREIFSSQVIKTADFLNSQHIVLHSGVGESKELFKDNLAKIYDKRIIVENMPKVAIDGRICFGYSSEQLNFIKNDCGLNMCLDFGHAAKSAVSQKLDYKEYIESLVDSLGPRYFHICGADLKKEKDEHLNLFEGSLDMAWVKNLLLKTAEKEDIKLVFETPKSGNDLGNDVKNINYFKDLNVGTKQ